MFSGRQKYAKHPSKYFRVQDVLEEWQKFPPTCGVHDAIAARLKLIRIFQLIAHTRPKHLKTIRTSSLECLQVLIVVLRNTLAP